MAVQKLTLASRLTSLSKQGARPDPDENCDAISRGVWLRFFDDDLEMQYGKDSLHRPRMRRSGWAIWWVVLALIVAETLNTAPQEGDETLVVMFWITRLTVLVIFLLYPVLLSLPESLFPSELGFGCFFAFF